MDEEKITKSSLRYLHIQQSPIGTPHNIWKAINSEQQEVRSAEIKARIMTGTYVLQTNAARYNSTPTSPVCQLCHKDDEDIEHFMLKCTELHSCRIPSLESLERLCNSNKANSYENILKEGLLLQLVMDCTHPDIGRIVTLKQRHLIDIERLSHQLVQKLHLRRTSMLIERAHLKISDKLN